MEKVLHRTWGLVSKFFLARWGAHNVFWAWAPTIAKVYTHLFMAATATPFPSLDVGPLAAKPMRLAMLGRSHKLQQGALNSLAFV